MNDSSRRAAYQKSFKKYGVSPKSLQWSSEKSAVVRYEQIVKAINFENKSVLDVGCGFGDLYKYIKNSTKDFDYTGLDIVPEFIKVAQNRFGKARFLVRDYFSDPSPQMFDIVVSSGTLNANVENAMEYRKNAIKVMLDHAKETLVFNMAGGYPKPENKKDARVYYADSHRMLKYCATLGGKVTLVDNYHPKDFTIVVSKM